MLMIRANKGCLHAALWRKRRSPFGFCGSSRVVRRTNTVAILALRSSVFGGKPSRSCSLRNGFWGDGEWEDKMAARKKKARRSSKPVELIISKSRTKGAVKKCNVGGEFYGALDGKVREMIKAAEARAIGNKRKTLKAVDL